MTVSAMKMEVHVKAPFAGALETLQVAQGDKVVEGTPLLAVILRPAGGGRGAGVGGADHARAQQQAGDHEGRRPRSSVVGSNQPETEKPEACPIAA